MNTTEPVLPNELWPEILCHLSLWQCYHFITVCKAWANGLIAQSINVFDKRNTERYLSNPHSLSLCNLTRLHTSNAQVFRNMLTKPNFFHKLQYLDIRAAWPASTPINSLTCLSVLRICNCHTMDYAILPTLASLTRLQFSGSAYCKLSNETLCQLPCLTDLTLRCAQFITDNTLGTLTLLRHLELDTNELLLGDSLYRLTNLRSLGLLGDSISTIVLRNSMTTLTSLNLNHNEGVFFSDITHLTQLVSLSLADTDMDSKVLESLPNLTRLIIAKNEQALNGLSGRWLANRLCGMTQLRELHFDNLQRWISDDCLGCLTQLTSMRIIYDHLITAGAISKLTSLTDLEIRSCDCSSLDLSLLPTSLRRLSFKNCTTEVAFETLPLRLTNLSELWLPEMGLSKRRNLPYVFSSLDRLYYRKYLIGNVSPQPLCLDGLSSRTEVLTY